MKTLLGATAAILIAAVPALAADDLNFRLNNGSSSPVTGFFVSHVGTNSWEENLMEGRTLAPGNAINVVIADGRTTCDYDIKVEFADGDTTDDRGLDLCEMGSYTVEDGD
jgi:hypothetical protein